MCGGPGWQREEVPDHKFDFVDTREFTDNGFVMRLKYLFLYLLLLKAFLVYISDIFTATTMLTTDGWSNDIYNSCPKDSDGCVPVDFNIGKWVFFGCIIFSFLLLAYEAHKARRIIKSRDISYAFTNVMANEYYSLRSYDHFCFFDHISNSTKRMDDYAFFVFFTFKGWKRLLLADGPRQAINAITLYSFYVSKQGGENSEEWDDFDKYFKDRDLIANVLMCVMLFTVIVFACSLLLLMVAGVLYVPLLCIIRGNLKEYCCYKVDKRIAEIIKRRNKARHAKAAALAQKEAEGDFSHLKGQQRNLPQPTLPTIALDDDLDDTASQHTRAAPGGPPSTYTASGDAYYYDQKQAQYAQEYPPMPGYNGQAPYDQYGNPSMATVYGEREPYFNDHHQYGSTAQLHPGGDGAHGAYDHHQYGHDQYAYVDAQRHAGHDNGYDGYDTPPALPGYAAPPAPGGYDDRDYPSPTSGGPPPRGGHPPQGVYDQNGADHKVGSGGGGYAM
jgi:hypothetical protein